jgi:choline dehydrogenase-like flavoprotein
VNGVLERAGCLHAVLSVAQEGGSVRLQQGLVDLTIISRIPVPGPSDTGFPRTQRCSGWSGGPFRESATIGRPRRYSYAESTSRKSSGTTARQRVPARGELLRRCHAEWAIHLSIDEKNNVEGVKRLRHKLDGMLSELGMHEHHLLDRSLYLHKSMPIGATAHQAGTVRFGTDPTASALDVNCKAHDVDNLYVVDTSFFPSIGAVNPSLTAIANALRVGDHITERLR